MPSEAAHTRLSRAIDAHWEWIAEIKQLEAEMRRIHPERYTERQWRDMRSMFISHLARLAEANRATVELLESIERSGRDSNS